MTPESPGLPTLDQYGCLRWRWISSGGVQITGRVRVDHLSRVLAARATRNTEYQDAARLLAGEVYLAEESRKPLRLPKRA